MRQNKVNILCTGPMDASLVDKAAEHNVLVDMVPFITISPVPAAEMEMSVKPLLKQRAVVVFTSGNAVEAVASCLDRQVPDWSIYCIGYNTRRLTEKYFGASAIVDMAAYGSLLAEKIKPLEANKPVLFFCGDQRRPELPDILKKRGVLLKEVVVYKTIPSPVKLEKKYDAVIFFSPSAVQSFFSMNAIEPGTLVFSIGSTTSKALQAFTGNTFIQPDTPEKEALINKLIDYFK